MASPFFIRHAMASPSTSYASDLPAPTATAPETHPSSRSHGISDAHGLCSAQGAIPNPMLGLVFEFWPFLAPHDSTGPTTGELMPGRWHSVKAQETSSYSGEFVGIPGINCIMIIPDSSSFLPGTLMTPSWQSNRQRNQETENV